MTSHLSSVTAAIFAGGLGTRLRSAVADRPKVLAEVLGRPYLSFLLDQVAKAGVRHCVLCTGYLGEQVEAAFGGTYRSLELTYSREESPLGTGGALRYALPHLRSDPVLVLNGDSYCHADLAAYWRSHRERGAVGSLLLTEVADTSRFGQVVVDETGALTSFREKQSAAGGAGWINAGVYLLAQELIAGIPPDRVVSLETEVLPSWIGRGLYGHPAAGPFLDIGTPESYAAAARFFADHASE